MTNLSNGDSTKCHLKVIVVGSGPVGLAAAWYLAKKGHSVTVLEKTPYLNAGGGDLQLSPNGTQLLRRIGLEPLIKHVCDPKSYFTMREWHEMKQISKSPVDVSGEYTSMMCRRDDLQKALYECAISAGARVEFSKEVQSLDESRPSVSLADGTTMAADLVIGADGVRSSLRTMMFPDRDTKPSVTQQVCFHFSVPYELLENDPDTKLMLQDHDSCALVLAEKSYLVYWPLETRKECYMIFSELEYNKPAEVGGWIKPADMDEVRQLYDHYPEPVRKTLQKVDRCEKWRLADGVEGADWVSASGKVVLLGDSIHAMVPHAAQGCTQGLEDVAALGEFLDQVHSSKDIPTMMRAFWNFREPRTSKIQQMSRMNIIGLSLPDGPAQQARDEQLRSQKVDAAAVEAWDNAPLDPNANFTDPGFLKWTQSYNVVSRAREAAAAARLTARI